MTTIGKSLPPNLFLHENGIYYIRKKRNGRRVKVSTGKRDLKAAMQVYHTLMLRWERGDTKEDPTFDEWWQDYEDAFTSQKKNPENDRQAVRAVMPMFTRRMLRDINARVCQRAVNDLRKRYAPSTVSMWCKQLKALFKRAVGEGVLEKNPWDQIAIENIPGRTQVLSREDQAKLLAALRPDYQRYVLAMLGTGLRVSEMKGLSVRDIDYYAHLLFVRNGKGGKSREVPLSTEVVAQFQAQIAAEGKLWPMTSQTVGQMLARACKRAAIPHLHPHVFRHTFATRFLQGGGDIYILSKILGHASVQTTEKVYAHLLKEDLVKRSAGIDLGLVAPQGAPTVAPHRETV